MSALTRRIALTLATTGLLGALVAGTSYAFFSSTATSQDNTFTAGTMSLTDSADTCTIGPMQPGDSHSCTYQVTYNSNDGNLNAWIGLDVATTGTAGPVVTPNGSQSSYGGTPLWSANDANGLQLSVTDSYNNTFHLNATDQVVGSSAVAPGWTDTFTVTGSLPDSAGNGYEGGSATVSLTAHAVQSQDNTNNAGTGPTSWQ